MISETNAIFIRGMAPNSQPQKGSFLAHDYYCEKKKKRIRHYGAEQSSAVSSLFLTSASQCASELTQY
jgi:hypothetical protein